MALMQFAGRSLDLSRPQVMGILNVTPDSFSDGGRYNHLDDALRQAEKMFAEGASIVDVGGESTRPGAKVVTLDEELERVLPVVEGIVKRFDGIVSVDTSSGQVMREAAKAGAGLINDVRALEREGALQAAAESNLPVCLMHMKGTPETMQENPLYDSVESEILAYLMARAKCCQSAGIASSRLILDPGIGFGKTLPNNLELVNRIDKFCQLGFPVLIGLSRKTMIGQLLNADVNDRLYGTLAGNAIAYQRGARLFRVHDVKPHVEMLEVMYRIEREA